MRVCQLQRPPGFVVEDRWRLRLFLFERFLTHLANAGFTSTFYSQMASVAGTPVFGLGRGFFDCNLMPVVCQVTRPQLRATGYGVLNFASTIVGGIMTLAAGGLKATLGLSAALQISAVLLFCAALLLLRVRPVSGSAIQKSA